LITTKRGKAGSTKVDINLSSGYSKVTRMIDLLNTTQYLQMRHEADLNNGITSPSSSEHDINGDWDTTRYTNWQKTLIGKNAGFTNAQLNISGGNANTQFLLGGSYNVMGNVYPGSFTDNKAAVHINLSHLSENRRFHTQFSTSYSNDNSNLPSGDLTQLIGLAPDAPTLYNSGGSLNWQVVNKRATWSNPLATSVRTASATTKSLNSSLVMDYEILHGLRIKGNFGYNNGDMDQLLLSPSTTSTAPPNNLSKNSRNFSASSDFQTWILEPQISYHKRISQGQLDVLAGSTLQEDLHNSSALEAKGFTSDALISNPLNASSISLVGKEFTLYHYDAAFGRIGYIWNDEYLINLTARRDGSSRFGPGKQFGNFEAIGVGWIFSKENSIQNKIKFLSYGKLRGSYGITGNDQIADYQYLSTYSTNPSTYQGITGLYPTNIANPYYSWEVVKKLQFGIDLGFIRDRILFSGTYYRNRDGNQLVGYQLPLVTGFNSIQSNFPALVQNNGEEFTLTTRNIISKNFSWAINVNITIPSNKLVAYPNINNSTYQYTYAVGHSIFSKYLFQYSGVSPQTGIYEFYSFTYKGDTSGPNYPTDLVLSKPITQKFYGGIQNSFAYKQFRLDIFVQFVNQLAYNYSASFTYPGKYNANQPTFVLNRWQHPGDNTNVGMFSYYGSEDPNGDLTSSTYIISNASFIRLKNLSLSYELPEKFERQAHFKCTFYVQCQNLWTITKYSGIDPETQGLSLPPMRTIIGGIHVNLN
jgi:TonB-linked SusC/RagA family outer membrane protein